MAYFRFQDTYKVDKPIIAFAEGVSAPFSVTLKASDYGPNYTDGIDGKKYFPAGHFIYRDSDGNNKILPRTLITNLINDRVDITMNLTIEVKLPYLFKVGQFVYIVAVPKPDPNTITTALVLQPVTGFFAELDNIDWINYEERLLGITVTSSTAETFINAYISNNNYVCFLTSEKVPSIGFTTSENILGVVPYSIDLESGPTTNVAVVNKAGGVYSKALPHVDPLLQYNLKSLNIKEKF
jgi:hypothetical protein